MTDRKDILPDVQANLDKLPDWCFGRHLSTNTIIRINKGEMGFRPITNQEWPKNVARDKDMPFDQFIDVLNGYENVTPAQRQAMQFGSMWGWGLKLADPDVYDEKGNILHEKLNFKK